MCFRAGRARPCRASAGAHPAAASCGALKTHPTRTLDQGPSAPRWLARRGRMCQDRGSRGGDPQCDALWCWDWSWCRCGAARRSVRGCRPPARRSRTRRRTRGTRSARNLMKAVAAAGIDGAGGAVSARAALRRFARTAGSVHGAATGHGCAMIRDALGWHPAYACYRIG